jgi:hypothetical protein
MTTKTVTVSGWIGFDAFRAQHPAAFPEGPWTFTTYKPGGNDTVPVREHSFTAEVPADFDPRPGMVEALQAKKRQLQAEFTKSVTDIERQISELQALEFTPA